MLYLIGLAALLLGLFVGERFPDVDQRTDLLLYRSILTHGLLLSLILCAVASKIGWTPLRWLSMGVALGVAVHLAFDLFPRAWTGFALVSIPVYGWLPASVSWAWIALSMVACVYMAGKLTRNIGEAGVFILAIAGVLYMPLLASMLYGVRWRRWLFRRPSRPLPWLSLRGQPIRREDV